MADNTNNINNNINNNQRIVRDFNSRSSRGRSQVEEFEAAQARLDNVTLENLSRQRRQLEEDQKHQQYLSDVVLKRRAEIAEIEREIQNNRNHFDQEKLDSLQNERYAIEEQIKDLEAYGNFLNERTGKLKESIENGSQVLKETYGISFEAFDEIEKISEEAKNELKKLGEVKSAIEKNMRNTEEELRDLLTLEQRTIDLDARAEIRSQIDEIEERLDELRSSRSDIESQERAQRRVLNRMGEGEEEDLGALGFAANTVGNGLILGGRGLGGLGNILDDIFDENRLSNILKSMGQSMIDTGSLAADFASGNSMPAIVSNIAERLGGLGELISVVNNIAAICGKIHQQFQKYVNDAAHNLANYFGVISANLEESSYTYQGISEKADNVLTASTLVRQTDYLNKIADLSNQGLIRDIETAAILETIKNKTLTSFDATNEGLRRLIRLNENDYIRQFGIEMQLKKALNAVFNDSGYLQSMFDGVTSAIMDASVSQQGDITAFNSTVQTWLGYMYSSGLSSGVIDSIAKGINSLGSGNISALASDESTQRLFLLAMDRVGMDYADILQQGLSLDDTNQLLGSIVQYLDEISNNTDSNLVLKSSYANLFNLSVTDMQAIHNLASQTASISSKIAGSSEAISQTVNTLQTSVADNTTTAEKFDILFDNLKYTFGETIAQNEGLYSTYRISQMAVDILNNFSSLGGVIGAGASVAARLAAIPQYVVDVVGLIPTIGDSITSFTSDGLTEFLSSSLLASSNSSANSLFSKTSNKSVKTINSKTFTDASAKLSSQIDTYRADTSFSDEEENKVLKLLEKMSHTLMQTSEKNHYAFAVSLEGMNDSVLRSFASIFADEDAMLKTFKGENKAIKKAMIEYLDDSTSNSKGGKTSS